MSYPIQSSSIDKWIDAPTRRVDAAGAMHVYRRRPCDRRAGNPAESLGSGAG